MSNAISRREVLALGMAAVMPRFAWAFGSGELPVTGRANSQLEPLDKLMTDFLTKHQLPGASLAVGRAGRVLYARGFGWADVESKTPVQPTSLFRLASVSKPITAVAVMHAVQQGCLSLDDKVVSRLGGFISEEPKDARWYDITLRHLLQHTGGWDRDKSFDAMFRAVEFARECHVDPPARPEHVIRAMLRVPLDFKPGERYAYSNFGYCLLGRVLECLDQRSYYDSVACRVLRPLGLSRLRLGRTLREHAHPDEVTYYASKNGAGQPTTGSCVFAPRVGEQVPWPYGGWHLEAMDAHGGWIGNATDLVRFAMSLDPHACCPLLGSQTLDKMWTKPSDVTDWGKLSASQGVHYGCGWSVRTLDSPGKINVWHTGSLDGTSTLLVRRHDGLCWAVLFNSRSGWSPDAGKFNITPSAAIDPLIHQVVDSTKTWPASDATF